jgi:RNA-directed DNA polymerase
MNGRKEKQLSVVPLAATQDRAIQRVLRWDWVEPSVWTERMLTTLETGVKGGKWFSLIDKVYSEKNLTASYQRVRRNKGAPGVDHETVEQFDRHAAENIRELRDALKEGRYQPQAVRRTYIPKPGTTKMRPLGIPTVKDRTVQGAIRNVLEPIWEARFADQSYGFRPKRSAKDALRRVSHLLETGHRWIVDADIQSYFDTIPQDRLMEEVRKEIADGAVLKLLESYLKQSVLEDLKEWSPTAGTPQGAVISPLLANIYLHPVDVSLKAAGFEMVRYADDLVILCRTEEKAQAALALLRQEMTERGLTLHPEKTRLVDLTKEGFEFLGYVFKHNYRGPRNKSVNNLKDKIRVLTPRNFGHSLDQMIGDLNRVLTGWFEYFKHSSKTAFHDIDGWIRRRIRSILRRRVHRRGISRGRDHNRWPNAFFRQRGLLTLHAARAALSQP